MDQFTVSDFVAPGFSPAGVDLGVATNNSNKSAELAGMPTAVRSTDKSLNSSMAHLGSPLLFRGSELQLRHNASSRRGALAPEANVSRYLLKMFTRCLALATFLLASTAFAPTARAQGDTEFGIWGGFSAGNPHLIGVTTDRQLGVLGLRYGHLIFDTHPVSLEYTLDIIPVEILRQPTYVACDTNPNIFPTGFCQTGHETVYGGGLNPLGLKLNFLREHRLQPIVASTAGLVASVRPIPVDIPEGTQFNFTFDFQAGFQLYNSDHSHAWTLAYKYQHISNAYRHSLNPGVDLHVITLGYSFFR